MISFRLVKIGLIEIAELVAELLCSYGFAGWKKLEINHPSATAYKCLHTFCTFTDTSLKDNHIYGLTWYTKDSNRSGSQKNQKGNHMFGLHCCQNGQRMSVLN